MKSQNFRIKEYSVFAGAFLLLNGHLKSEVIYTDIDPDITLQFDNESAGVDMDNNGTIDFAFLKTYNTYTTYWTSSANTNTFWRQCIFAGPYIFANEIAGPYLTHSGSHWYFAYAIDEGALIDDEVSFTNFGYNILAIKGAAFWATGGAWWPIVEDHYLGVHFKEAGNYHYGWIRCSIDSAETIIIKDYAYETEPEHAILAGDTVSYVAVHEIESAIEANVYSYQKNIYIQLDANKNTLLTIVDDSGRKLIERTLQNDNEIINMSNYPVGVYIVRLLQGQKHLDRKVIIQ